jgi:hypothetical protein
MYLVKVEVEDGDAAFLHDCLALNRELGDDEDADRVVTALQVALHIFLEKTLVANAVSNRKEVAVPG